MMSMPINNVLEGCKIRRLIDERMKAVRAKDVEASAAVYAPDLLLFDVIDPLQYAGSESARKRAAEWFASLQEPLGYEVRDLTIDAGDDVAFSRGLNHITAMKQDGTTLDMWWRSTVCYRKVDGRWIVTHEHNSVPLDVRNGMAAVDLKP